GRGAQRGGGLFIEQAGVGLAPAAGSRLRADKQRVEARRERREAGREAQVAERGARRGGQGHGRTLAGAGVGIEEIFDAGKVVGDLG
nr:hypothetical protein [Tanacetum cinerariifolium]